MQFMSGNLSVLLGCWGLDGLSIQDIIDRFYYHKPVWRTCTSAKHLIRKKKNYKNFSDIHPDLFSTNAART